MGNFLCAIAVCFFIWAVISAFGVYVAEGRFLYSKLDTEVKAYFIGGAIIGLATVFFGLALIILFEKQTEHIQLIYDVTIHNHEHSNSSTTFDQEAKTNELARLENIKEFFNLLVAVFGAGVSGNLIVAAIIKQRDKHASQTIKGRTI